MAFRQNLIHSHNKLFWFLTNSYIDYILNIFNSRDIAGGTPDDCSPENSALSNVCTAQYTGTLIVIKDDPFIQPFSSSWEAGGRNLSAEAQTSLSPAALPDKRYCRHITYGQQYHGGNLFSSCSSTFHLQYFLHALVGAAA